MADIETKTVETPEATIYVGSWDRDTGRVVGTDKIRQVAQEYVDEVGLCVFVYEGQYIYTDGREHGAAVHLMNYPRFPSSVEEVHGDAISLGVELLQALQQQRITVKTPEATTMLSDRSKL